MRNYNTAYLLARLSVGMSMFAHGFIRLTKLSVFSESMVAEFSKSIMPLAVVKPFSLALPFFEFLVGVLLLLGLFTRQALITGVVIMLTLLFGTGMVEKWDAIPAQLIHAAFFSMLLASIQYNTISFDALITKKKQVR
jgi:thiosulfate dehydrogenase [quinone] large subunit